MKICLAVRFFENSTIAIPVILMCLKYSDYHVVKRYKVLVRRVMSLQVNLEYIDTPSLKQSQGYKGSQPNSTWNVLVQTQNGTVQLFANLMFIKLKDTS